MTMHALTNAVVEVRCFRFTSELLGPIEHGPAVACHRQSRSQNQKMPDA
jgi:hypothetical protein